MSKKKIIAVVVIGGIVLLLLGIKIFNNVRKSNDSGEEELADAQATISTTLQEPTPEVEEEPIDLYKSSLSLDKDKDNDGRVDVPEESPTPVPTPVKVQTEPKYKVTVNVFDKTGVPDKNVDGSSCKDYLSKVSLKHFGTFWGEALTEKDFKGHKRYLIGVSQDKEDFEKGDLESVGWLMDNMKKFKNNDAFKFTNLHVIGSLSDSHVALLCSYDWYSVFGLKDTLVVFEDISNTLSVKDFKPGDIFSATVFKHNMKVMSDVAGQRVICVEYNVFDDNNL